MMDEVESDLLRLQMGLAYSGEIGDDAEARVICKTLEALAEQEPRLAERALAMSRPAPEEF